MKALTPDHRLGACFFRMGSMEIIINLRDREAAYIRSNQLSAPARKPIAGAGSPGPHSEFIVIDTAPNASMIGVHLRAWRSECLLRSAAV